MAGIVTTVLPIVTKVLDRLIPDKVEAAKVQAELEAELVKSATTIQAEIVKINQLDATGISAMQRTWRPAIGWSCALGVFWTFVGYPFTSWILQLLGNDVPVPTVPTDLIFEMTIALLGLGSLRTYEKSKGIA